MLPSTLDIAEIAALANAEEAAASSNREDQDHDNLTLESVSGSSGSRRRKKKGGKRAHRRSKALNSHDSSSNLDFLNELPIPDKKEKRGLRNRVNEIPVSYERAPWMNYKNADKKKARRSTSSSSSESKQRRGDRTSPRVGSGKVGSRRINAVGKNSPSESKVGTPRNKLASPLSARGSPSNLSSPSVGRTSSRGEKKGRRKKNGSKKLKGTPRAMPRKTQTNSGTSTVQPKRANLPAVNGARSVAALLQDPAAAKKSPKQNIIRKKKDLKVVSMTKNYKHRSNTAAADAFLTQVQSSSSPTRKVRTGFAALGV